MCVCVIFIALIFKANMLRVSFTYRLSLAFHSRLVGQRIYSLFLLRNSCVQTQIQKGMLRIFSMVSMLQIFPALLKCIMKSALFFRSST